MVSSSNKKPKILSLEGENDPLLLKIFLGALYYHLLYDKIYDISYIHSHKIFKTLNNDISSLVCTDDVTATM